jgi:UDP-N-acetyl-2-amino-2-deoxyglucuronate dehydrogenase
VQKPLRVGIVGLGAVGMVHIKAYGDMPDIELVGVADVDPERQEFAREQLKLPGYSTVGGLLQSARPDLCCILTPPAAHESATIECAEAGVHVLCEKPLALSINSCESMISACERNGVELCYGASYRYLPAVMVARDMILRGELGRVVLLHEHAVGGIGPERRRVLGPSHYPIGGPGGSPMGLCDHGIHLIDAFSWMMGSPVAEAWGRGNISGQPLDTEVAHLKYANGALGQLLYNDGTYSTELPNEGIFSWGAGWTLEPKTDNDDVEGAWQFHPGSIHVHGTNGSLRIFHYANALFFRNSKGVRQVALPNRPVPANFSAQLQAFIAALHAGRPAPVTGQDGLAACRALLSVYDSAVRR